MDLKKGVLHNLARERIHIIYAQAILYEDDRLILDEGKLMI